MMYLVAGVVVVLAVQAWALWRMAARLRGLTRLEARLATFAHSLTLLTDTTETCFQTLAAQLSQDDLRPLPTPGRAARQRRVIGAARRGRSIGEIAAREELAESEVRLRLHLAEPQIAGVEGGRHGAMR